MKSRLYILQHGDAVTKQEDPDRPLSQIGRLDIEQLARYLLSKDVLIERILHSGKLRSMQSAQIIATYLAPDIALEKQAGIGPNDDAVAFVKKLELGNGSLLIASHMPFVSNASSVLLNGSVTSSFGFSPGTVACFENHNESWSLKCMISPDNLKSIQT